MWQEAPRDIHACVISLSWTGRSMMLDDIYFEDSTTFVTGVRLFQASGHIRLGIYGRSRDEHFFKSGEDLYPYYMESFSEKKALFNANHQFVKTYKESVQFVRMREWDVKEWIPSFGTKHISTSPLSLLSGIGFVHLTNSMKEYAGVILPYVRTENSGLENVDPTSTRNSPMKDWNFTNLNRLLKRAETSMHKACRLKYPSLYVNGKTRKLSSK